MLELAEALSQARDPGVLPLERILPRLGLPSAEHGHGLGEVEAGLEAQGEDALARRIQRARLGCGIAVESVRCLHPGCGQIRCEHKMRCHVREACPRCLAYDTRDLVEWLRRAWEGPERVVVAELEGSRDELARARDVVREKAGAHALACVAPTVEASEDGGWTQILLADAKHPSAPFVLGFPSARRVSRSRALDLLAGKLLRRGVVVQELAARGEHARAVEIVIAIAGGHRLLGDGGLARPTNDVLREDGREARAIQNEHAGLGCGHEGPSRYEYSYRGQEVLVSLHPESLAEVVTQAIRLGACAPAVRPSRSVPLRR
jgi:hypothetical protein